jgi:hypothetical protein
MGTDDLGKERAEGQELTRDMRMFRVAAAKRFLSSSTESSFSIVSNGKRTAIPYPDRY